MSAVTRLPLNPIVTISKSDQLIVIGSFFGRKNEIPLSEIMMLLFGKYRLIIIYINGIIMRKKIKSIKIKFIITEGATNNINTVNKVIIIKIDINTPQ